MPSLTLTDLERLFTEVGAQLAEENTLYLIGGMALHILGNPRLTQDVDYVGSDLAQGQTALQQLVAQVADTLQIPVEAVPLTEFLPLPDGANQRHQIVGRYGLLTVYLFDPYSIALSKIERGFETDLADVLFLLRHYIIEWSELERHAQALLPQAAAYLIDPLAFQAHLQDVRRSLGLE